MPIKKRKRIHPPPQRALKVFSVSYAGIRLRVRLLPHARNVYTELTGGAQWRMRAELPEGFFLGSAGKFTGTIVLAANANLNEIVPHEVVHAVLHKMNSVESSDDEPFAYAVGILTARILKKIKYIELER